MKRWFYLFLCTILCISLPHWLFAQDATLRVLDGSGNPGSQGNPVFIELSNSTQVGVVQFVLSFDGSILNMADFQPTGRTENMGTFSWVPLDSGTVIVLVQDLMDMVIEPGVGPIAACFFDVAEGKLGGEVDLHLSNAILYDLLSNPLSVAEIDGTFRITVPDISLSAQTHTYGYVLLGSSETWNVIILNEGTGVLSISDITSDNFEFAVISPSFPQDVAPGGDMKVTIVFSPAIEGPRSASLSIHSNDPDESQKFISLGGGGTSVDIEVSVTGYDFSTVRVGSTSDRTLFISNLGIADLTVFDIVSNHFDFGVVQPIFPQLVAPEESLEVIIRFQPTSVGILTATLTLTSDDPDEASIPLSLTGIGIAPSVQFSESSHDFNKVEVGTSEGWILTIYNTGSADLTISEISSDNTEFTITFPTFPQTIPPSGNLETVVSFVPSNVGERTAVLTIVSDDPFNQTSTVSLTGQGVPSATLQIGHGSGTPGTFGNVIPVLLTNLKSIKGLRFIVNYDPFKLHISNINPTERTIQMGIFSWSEPVPGKIICLAEDLADEVIGPGSGAVAQLFFDVMPGVFPIVETLNLSDVVLSDPYGNPVFTLFDEPGSFTITASEIALSATDHSFGPVLLGNSTTWTLKVFNEGTIDLSIIGVTSTQNNFSVFTLSFPQTVAAGGSLEVVIQFSPTSLGLLTAAITIISDDPDEPLLSVFVNGTGVVPNIELSAYSHHYGDIVMKTSSPWLMTIYNSGTAALVITHTAVDHVDFLVTSPQFPQTIEPSDSLVVTVDFTPLSLGTISGTLTIFSSDPEEGELSVLLMGVGTAPLIEVSERSHNFGEVVVGGVRSWLVRILNLGTADLTVHTITTDRLDYSVVTPSFPQTVPPNGFFDVMISFSPRAEGSISGQLTISSDDPNEGFLVIPVEGRGIAADIHLEAVHHDFGPLILNASDEWTLHILNLGIVLLEVKEVTTGTSDFVISSPIFPQSILPGDTIEVSVLFRPSELGVLTDTIKVMSSDPDEGILTVFLQGNGVAPHINLSAESYDFGNIVVGRKVSWDLVIQNTGTYELYIRRFFLTDSLEFKIENVALPDTLVPTEELILSLTFEPTSPGMKTDELMIQSSDIDLPIITFSLYGQGSPPPELSVFDRMGQPGESDNVVPLNLVNVMTISKAILTLHYDVNRLTLSDVRRTVRIDHMDTFTWLESSPGQIEMTIDDGNDNVIQAGSGWIIEISFNVKSDALLGEAPLRLTNVTLLDIDGKSLPKEIEEGTFEVVQTKNMLVTVALPHRSRPTSDTLNVPVKLLRDITGLDVFAMEFDLIFDPQVLTAIEVSDRGNTIAELWRLHPTSEYIFLQGIGEDRITVALAAAIPLWGEGVFINITFQVSTDAQPGKTSSLHFENFRVNEGQPPAEFIDGWFSVASVPDIDFSFRSHDFDSVTIRESKSWQLTIFNVGSEDLVVDSIVSTVSDFTFDEMSLPRTVSSDGSFDVVVSFQPSQLGEIIGLMKIVSNDTDEPTSFIFLRGVGVTEVGVELADLSGLWTGHDVVLSGSPSGGSDVIGFHVYRKGEGEIAFQRLTSSPVPYQDEFLFHDFKIPGPGTYLYQIGEIGLAGEENFIGTITVKVDALISSSFLSQNYPNPFNPETKINYTVERAGWISLFIYNVLGERVRTLVSGNQSSGHYSVVWNGVTDAGEEAPSGLYFYHLKTSGFSEVRSMLLLR